MPDVGFIDVTLRDGQASLWAEAMTTGMMLSVASQMDQIGFKSIELIATSHFKKCIRELHEDPWERVRLIAKRITKTPLTMVIGSDGPSFEPTPSALLQLWMKRVAANGMARVRCSDADFRIGEVYRFAREAGLKFTLNLVYSVSPRHTDEYYAQSARYAAELKVDNICLKDPSGLIVPERVRTLIPVIMANANGIPIEFHSHCTTGLAPLCYLEALKLGVTTLHTAIPPLANGSSMPSMFNIARNARSLGFTPAIDEKAVKPIADRLQLIAKREGFPIGVPLEYDYHQYRHQVPGGVISNSVHQLTLIKLADRLDEVLEETVRVRQDLGYPIMVTPYSQFVVTQAAINVMLGERYKTITDQVIKYGMGFWGDEAASLIDPDVMDKIRANPRAKQFANWVRPDPTLKEIRQKLGGPGVSDDELLLRYITGKEEIKAMRAVGPIKEYTFADTPLVELMRELTKLSPSNSIHIQKKDFSVMLRGTRQHVSYVKNS